MARQQEGTWKLDAYSLETVGWTTEIKKEIFCGFPTWGIANDV